MVCALAIYRKDFKISDLDGRTLTMPPVMISCSSVDDTAFGFRVNEEARSEMTDLQSGPLWSAGLMIR